MNGESQDLAPPAAGACGGDRAEIDTSATFESVREAVDRFGGSAAWSSHFIKRMFAPQKDAEKEPEKTWSPIVEIKFVGRTYRGRCQGVPEGKGRLTYSDGSFYDVLWSYGKISGLGTLYSSNGDVFHGTWRDDLIHGKVWYYFHSGDGWFANFGKWKANGEMGASSLAISKWMAPWGEPVD